MQSKITIKQVYILIVILLMAIMLPSILFVIQFSNQQLSNNISDWGSFGDFFGGLLNPFFALINIAVLGYLTYLVSNLTIQENENLQLRVRKMDAYRELTDHIPYISTSGTLLNNLFHNMILKLDIYDPDKVTLADLLDKEKQLAEDIYRNIANFNSLLSSFKTRYGFLFSFDFNSQEFEQLKFYVSELETIYKEFSYRLELIKYSNKNVFSEEIGESIREKLVSTIVIQGEISKNLEITLSKLRKELEKS